MRLSEEKIRAAVAEQAGDWYVAQHGETLAHADRVAFVAWLRASPMHVEEYLGIALTARDLPDAANELTDTAEALVAQARADLRVAALGTALSAQSPRLPANRGHRRLALAALATGCACVLVGLIVWRIHDGELLGLPKSYHTAHGEQSAQLLPDGSVLRLNTESSVTVRYSGSERLVTVEAGQALFQVLPEAKRRFRVVAGDAQVRAVGTEFEVYRQPRVTLVTVIEGSVDVSAGRVGAAAGAGSRPGLRVQAGYQLRIDAGEIAAQPTPVDLRQSEAWVRRRLLFEQRRLGDVAEEFNRYASVPLVIADPALRALPVSGAFSAYDVDSFAAFLATLPGVSVQRSPAQIRITRALDSKP